MKRSLAMMMALCCTATMLSGCGSQTAADTSNSANTDTSEQVQLPTYTLEEIRENNSIENILKRHASMVYTQEFYEYSGNEKTLDTTIKIQYRTVDGKIQSDRQDTDADGEVFYTDQMYADKTYEGASYAIGQDGQKYMALYTPEDYSAALNTWLDAPSSETATETVQDTSMQDGAIIVTVRTDYRNEAEVYDLTLYYIDPETDDLLAKQTTSYSTADDQEIAESELTVSFDNGDTFTLEKSPFEAITGGTDYCEVSMILNPQQDDIQVCWYPVAHDTQLMFGGSDNYTLYSDEELTQPLDGTNIDVTGAVRNVFVVKRQ